MQIVYDVETLRLSHEVPGGWDNPYGMGFGTAVIYIINTDQYRFYGPEDLDKLRKLLLDANLIIGFNHIKFDNKVIFGNEVLLGDSSRNYDILQEVIKSKFKTNSIDEAVIKYGRDQVFNHTLNLNAIALHTLGMSKTGSGESAPKLIKEKRWAEVFEYNLNDVRLTYKLYRFIQKFRYVSDGLNNLIQIQQIPRIWEK